MTFNRNLVVRTNLLEYAEYAKVVGGRLDDSGEYNRLNGFLHIPIWLWPHLFSPNYSNVHTFFINYD